MSTYYEHWPIEQKWIKKWERNQSHSINLVNATRPYYNLLAIPYPYPGGLHLGNLYAFTGSDIHGRFMRAKGYDVFQPIGFNAFGIQSENTAIKENTHPEQLIKDTIQNCWHKQLRRIGAMFDWSHIINTTDPDYYRWTQWIFIRLFKSGLVYQREASINWCSDCRKPIADWNIHDQRCKRCHSQITRKAIHQWYFKLSAFADQLMESIDTLEWPDRIKDIQKKWIGRHSSVRVHFPVHGTQLHLEVITDRPELLWGTAAVIISADHPQLAEIVTPSQRSAVTNYILTASLPDPEVEQKPASSGHGINTGGFCINPVNDEKIPVWVSTCASISGGTGAVLCVPAHNHQDYAFAQINQLSIRQVIEPLDITTTNPAVYTGHGILLNSGEFTGTFSHQARKNIIEWLEINGKGRQSVQYQLQDWCVSRQRYWGTPIPLIHCPTCGILPVPEDQLPVLIPHDHPFKPAISGKLPLERSDISVHTSCPSCHGPAQRETDVCDHFLDTAWYFIRFPNTHIHTTAFDPATTAKWLPVDMYIGNHEQIFRHILYARFLTKALKIMDFIEFDEPFRRLQTHGLIRKDGLVMSLDLNNTISPDEYIVQYGADTLRLYLMLLSPYPKGGNIRDISIKGAHRFIKRLWNYMTGTRFSLNPNPSIDLKRFVHRKIKNVTDDIQCFHYNTAICSLMELLNALIAHETDYLDFAFIMLQLTAPFAPFITHELWERLGGEGLVGDLAWPNYDESLIQEKILPILLQVNGKTRSRVMAQRGLDQDQVIARAKADQRLVRWIEHKRLTRVVFIPDRLINFVI